MSTGHFLFCLRLLLSAGYKMSLSFWSITFRSCQRRSGTCPRICGDAWPRRPPHFTHRQTTELTSAYGSFRNADVCVAFAPTTAWPTSPGVAFLFSFARFTAQSKGDRLFPHPARCGYFHRCHACELVRSPVHTVERINRTRTFGRPADLWRGITTDLELKNLRRPKYCRLLCDC